MSIEHNRKFAIRRNSPLVINMDLLIYTADFNHYLKDVSRLSPSSGHHLQAFSSCFRNTHCGIVSCLRFLEKVFRKSFYLSSFVKRDRGFRCPHWPCIVLGYDTIKNRVYKSIGDFCTDQWSIWEGWMASFSRIRICSWGKPRFCHSTEYIQHRTFSKRLPFVIASAYVSKLL